MPLHDFNQNQIWCAIISLAGDIVAWMQMLGLHHTEARRWEPKRLRMRLFTVPATIVTSGRATRLRVAEKAPWAHLVDLVVSRLRVLAAQPRIHCTAPG